MKSKQILFFATAIDIQSIVNLIESECQIKYYEMGLFDTKPESFYNSVSEISNFCIPKFGDWNKDLRLMGVPKHLSINIREVPQRNGGVKYAIDPLENSISICFQFGGIYEEGIILGGSCGTTFINEFSMQIFNKFSSKLKKEFKKIENFYVGNNAEKKLRQGWRLVTNEKLPKEYDLSMPFIQDT